MRLGWSVLCNDLERHDDGTVTLERVFMDTALGIQLSSLPPVQVTLNPPVTLVSYWFSESKMDQSRYPAVLRVLAPGDNHILAEWHFAVDLLGSTSSLTIFHLVDLTFVGDGLYEVHIDVQEFGEWSLVSRNTIFLRKTVQ